MKQLFAIIIIALAATLCQAQTTGPATSLAPTTLATGDTVNNNFQMTIREKRPGASTVALAGGGAGNVANGTHRVKVEFTTAAGHSDPGIQSSIVTVVDKTVDGKIAISGIPTGSVFVTGRKVYMTTAAGTVYHLLSNGTIANNTATTLTANDSDATLAAATVMPTGNTTGNQFFRYTGSSGTVTIPNLTVTTCTGCATTPSGSITSSGYTMNTAKLLGRNTASTGAVEEITLGTGLSFSGTTLNAAGGITNSAGAGVVPVTIDANGNQGPSQITDDGTDVAIGGAGLSNLNGTTVNITAATQVNITTSGGGSGISVTDATDTTTISTASLVLNGNGGAPVVRGTVRFDSSPLPEVTGTAFGGTTLPWASLFVGNAAGESSQITGSFTGNRVATLPDATGNVMLTSFANTNLTLDKTVTAGGTTGAQQIDKPAGSVNFAAAATSLVVTNSLVSTSSIILCTVATNDATMKAAQCVAGTGSFTIFASAAATAETRVNFLVVN